MAVCRVHHQAATGTCYPLFILFLTSLSLSRSQPANFRRKKEIKSVPLLRVTFPATHPYTFALFFKLIRV